MCVCGSEWSQENTEKVKRKKRTSKNLLPTDSHLNFNFVPAAYVSHGAWNCMFSSREVFSTSSSVVVAAANAPDTSIPPPHPPVFDDQERRRRVTASAKHERQLHVRDGVQRGVQAELFPFFSTRRLGCAKGHRTAATKRAPTRTTRSWKNVSISPGIAQPMLPRTTDFYVGEGISCDGFFYVTGLVPFFAVVQRNPLLSIASSMCPGK